MIEVNITAEMIDRAQKKVDRFEFNTARGLSKFGSEKGRTLFGYIGEQMVANYLELTTDVDDFEFDQIYNKKKLEIKTISCKFKPTEDFLCTVNSYDLSGIHRQDADYYVFTRILTDKSKGWILGYIKCSEFFEKGKFIQKGTQLFKGVSFIKANATVLKISKLYPISELKQNGSLC